MRAMIGRLQALGRFGRDRRGATAIEYAMIAGGVSIAIVAVVVQVGDSMKTLFYDKLVGMF
jgi:pilus assembly protein Flp/PilA